MKPNHLGILTVAAAACLATASLSSQDSASVDKDPNKVVLMQGVFKSIDWTNPAVQVHLDVQNSKGKTEHWVMEGDSPATMLRRGFARDTIQSGQAIIVCGLMPGQSPPARRVAGATLDAGGIANFVFWPRRRQLPASRRKPAAAGIGGEYRPCREFPGPTVRQFASTTFCLSARHRVRRTAGRFPRCVRHHKLRGGKAGHPARCDQERRLDGPTGHCAS